MPLRDGTAAIIPNPGAILFLPKRKGKRGAKRPFIWYILKGYRHAVCLPTKGRKMPLDFGESFRRLRQGRDMTQRELSRRAGLSLRTISYWEAGTRLPRIPELENALRALCASPPERTRLMALSATPRGAQAARREALDTEAGPTPEIGDLLRAMRMRRGWTQERLAAELQTKRLTALRWETTKQFPSEENLERLCDALGAYPEERLALRERRLTTPLWTPEGSLEECVEATAHFRRQVDTLATPLIDLNALALKRRLRLLAGQAEEALRLLAIVELKHSGWLLAQNRLAESRRSVGRALNGAQENRPPAWFWANAVNIASLHAKTASGANDAAFAVVKQWQPRLSDNYAQTFLLSDMALYASFDKKAEEAKALLDAARQAQFLSGHAVSAEYFKITESRIRMRLYGEAVDIDWLLARCGTTDERIVYLMMWAEGLLAGGDRQTALHYMTQAQAEITAEVTPMMRQRVAEVSRRF